LLGTQFPKTLVADNVISPEMLKLCGISSGVFGQCHQFKRLIQHTIMIGCHICDEVGRGLRA